MMEVGRQMDPADVMGTPEHAAQLTEGRHPGVRDALSWLAYSHLPAVLQDYSRPFYWSAVQTLASIRVDSPELTTTLNKLIEAKDSAVRAGIKSDTGRAGSVALVDPPQFGNYGPGQPRPRPIKDNPQG